MCQSLTEQSYQSFYIYCVFSVKQTFHMYLIVQKICFTILKFCGEGTQLDLPGLKYLSLFRGRIPGRLDKHDTFEFRSPAKHVAS